MIQIPRITKPTSGLTLVTVAYPLKDGTKRHRKVWRATWREDGRGRQRSLRTSDLGEAIALRDAVFHELKASGAKCSHPREARYIYRRSGFVVKVPGFPIEYCETEAEAEKVREERLSEVNAHALAPAPLDSDTNNDAPAG